MAITKVFAIRLDFEQTVRYAVNEQKTSLDSMIDYAVNPDKTEQRLFESCLNCSSVENASRDMERTKRRYNKMGGIQGYHIIQSFKPGELTPEQTHAIGVEFAKRLFGERFEVVIGTHLDKHHLHNHIAVNSVSFLDGKKLRCNMKTYFQEIQKVSDELCREHGLSVIEPKGKGKSHQEWQAAKSKQPTIREQVRRDIDGIIGKSLNFTTFLDELRKDGYQVRSGNRKHTAVKPPYGKKFIRLDSLGENYTDSAIEKRILSQRSWNRSKQLPVPQHYTCKGSFKKHPKVHGFRALYFHYVYLLRDAAKGHGSRKVSVGICWRTRYDSENIWRSTGFWQNTESKPPRNCNPPRTCSPHSLIPLCGSENHSTKKGGTPMKSRKRCCRWRSARAPPRSNSSAENCGSASRSKRTLNGCRPVFTM